MAKSLGTIYAELGLKLDKFDQGLRDAESSLKKAETRLEGFRETGERLSSMGRDLTMKVTLPIAALGVASVKAFADFDDAMTGSLAIMGNVSIEMRNKMERVARDVANTTRYSAKEAADAYFYLASAGLDATQSIEALPRVAQFAAAGKFDLARATDLLTDAQSALGLAVDDTAKNMQNMTRVSDVLVKANTLANATVEQFSSALTNKAGAALRLLNKDVEEGVAVLAAWADQGVKGEAAGEQLNIVLRDLQTASLKNREEFDRMRISVFDAQGNMRNLADIVGDLEGALSGMSDEQKRATLMQLGFQDRSVSAMMTLLGTSDAIRGYERDLRSAGGTTQEVADKQMQSLSARLDTIKSRLWDNAMTIGEILVPMVEQLANVVDWLTRKFDQLSPGMQKTIVVTAGLVAAIGPLIWITGQLFQSISSIGAAATFVKGKLAALAAAKTAAGTAAGGMGASLTALAGPLAIAAAGVAVLGLYVREYTRVMAMDWRTHEQVVKDTFDGIVNKFVESKLSMLDSQSQFHVESLNAEIAYLEAIENRTEEQNRKLEELTQERNNAERVLAEERRALLLLQEDALKKEIEASTQESHDAMLEKFNSYREQLFADLEAWNNTELQAIITHHAEMGTVGTEAFWEDVRNLESQHAEKQAVVHTQLGIMLSEYEGHLAEVGQVYDEGLGNLIPIEQRHIKESGERWAARIDGMREQGYEMGRQGMAEYKRGLEEGTPTAETAAKKIGTGSRRELIEGLGDTSKIGDDVTSGLAKGIEADKGGAMEAARKLAKKVSDAIKAALKISSPSQVTEEDGAMIVAGLALGIEKNMSKVYDIRRKMADAVSAPQGIADLPGAQRAHLSLVAFGFPGIAPQGNIDPIVISQAVYRAVRDGLSASKGDGHGESGTRELVIEIDGKRLARVLLPSIEQEKIRVGEIVA